MRNLEKLVAAVRVSSVLNRDTKQFGSKHLLDDDDDTCWNSDQGLPQWISIKFSDPEELKQLCISIQFQGGFCGKDCVAEFADESKNVTQLPFYPDDENSLQKFEFSFPESKNVKYVKLLFQKSTDFYGRIIVYKLGLNTVQ